MSKNLKTNLETGLRLIPVSSLSNLKLGDFEVSASTFKAYFHNGTSSSPLVTEAHSATLTNKGIDADNNSVSNLVVANLKAGVLNTSITMSGASDSQIPSALAIKTYVDNALALQNEASEITLVPYDFVTATNVQDGMEQIIDKVNVSGDVVGTTDSQILTNKTFDDELRLKQIATPSNPSAGYDKLYFKNDDNLYKKTSTGIEEVIASGALLRQSGNSKASPVLLDASDNIIIESHQRGIVYIAGDASAVTLISNPQIPAATLVEQELVIVGTSNTNTVTLVNGNGLVLNGDVTLGDYEQISLRYDGTNWVEQNRNF